VMILGEVEEILEVVDARNFKTIAEPLFHQLAKSLMSSHFQVSPSCSSSPVPVHLVLQCSLRVVEGNPHVCVCEFLK